MLVHLVLSAQALVATQGSAVSRNPKATSSRRVCRMQDTEATRDPAPAVCSLGPVVEYMPGPPTAAVVPPGQCAFTDEWSAVPLTKREAVSHDTLLLSFGLDESRPLGLSTCACLLARASIDGSDVVRPYTPVSTNAMRGAFQLLVKVYPEGEMSSHLASLPLGATVDFKHIAANVKRQYPFGVRKVVMLAGGTGITPMLQALHALLGTADDQTETTLLYSSKTEADILARTALDSWAASHAGRFRITHTLTQEPTTSAWSGQRGRIDGALIAQNAPPPGDGDVLFFVCGPPAMYDALAGPRSEPELSGALAALGYTAEQVVKM